MPLGKVGLKGLGRLGGGLGPSHHGESSPPIPQIESFIILEDDTGYILLEDNKLILTET